MRIILAKHSGFCMGVRNAVLKVINELQKKGDRIYVYGPLIHNPQTIELLKMRGLRIIDDISDIEKKQVAIRTHGVPFNEFKEIKSKARRVINLTCPHVAKVQSIIKKYSNLGFFVVIVGDRDHAEVAGLRSYASRGCAIISDKSDVASIPVKNNCIVVAQTTADQSLFLEVVEEVKNRCENIEIINTICESTRLRQDDVLEGIKLGADTIVVVGGKNSANTRRLTQLGEQHHIKTIHIETENEILESDFSSASTVLVTAGASTPGWIINNVLEKLYYIKYKKTSVMFHTVMRIAEFLVKANIVSAMGAFFLSILTQRFLHFSVDYTYALTAALFIFSMYSVNNYLERDSMRINNPYKFRIYERFGKLFLILSIISLLSIVPLSFQHSEYSNILLIVSICVGSIYSLKPVSNLINSLGNLLMIRAYNSRIATSFGWMIVTVFLPAIESHNEILHLSAMCLFTFTMVFMRQNLMDIVAYHGDLILGRVTLLISLGIRNLGFLLGLISAVTAAIFTLVALQYDVRYLIFIATIIIYWGMFFVLKATDSLISLKYEPMIDANFLVLGVLLWVL